MSVELASGLYINLHRLKTIWNMNKQTRVEINHFTPQFISNYTLKTPMVGYHSDTIKKNNLGITNNVSEKNSS